MLHEPLKDLAVPQTQALERAQPVLRMDLGAPERQTHNYIRHGTLDLFAALNVATGKVITRISKQHRAKEFVDFLRDIDKAVQPDLEVHVVLDNLSTHKTPAVHRWLIRHPRFHLHFTPTYSSWLNLVECFLGLLTQEALQRGSHTSVAELRKAIANYVEAHNEEQSRSDGRSQRTRSSRRSDGSESARSRPTGRRADF